MTEQPEKNAYEKVKEKRIEEVFQGLENPEKKTELMPTESGLSEKEQAISKCKFCGRETIGSDVCYLCLDNPTRQEFLKKFFEHQGELTKEISPEELTRILSTTIKRDDITKLNVFLDMLLTYTDNEQQNVGLIAGSSTGKSYIPLELVPYFPKLDVIKLGYASPTSFFHQQGLWMRDPRLPQLVEGYEEHEDEEERKKRQAKENLIVVDLHQKILVFLDSPHSELLKNLRSLLAHDDNSKYYEQRITDRTQKGNRTKRILLIGYPTVLFCSTNTNLDDQEKTRMNLYSPDSSPEKISDAITHRIHKSGNQELYEKQIAENPERQFLQIRVSDIKQMGFKNITIPEDLQAEIDEHFKEIHKVLQPRHQRDAGKLVAKIKAFALLNYHNRKYDLNGNLEVNRDDLLNGFAQYETYRESNELGLPPESYNAFIALGDSFLSPGLTLEEYQKEYFKVYHVLLGRDKARANLKSYTTVGLLYENPDPNDRRRTRYMCGEVGVIEIQENGRQSFLEVGYQKKGKDTPTPFNIYPEKNFSDDPPGESS